jgi:hypothetical protein
MQLIKPTDLDNLLNEPRLYHYIPKKLGILHNLSVYSVQYFLG